MFSFNLNPTETNTVFTHTIGEFFQWLSIFAVNQVQVQRYLSVPSARDLYKLLGTALTLKSSELFVVTKKSSQNNKKSYMPLALIVKKEEK